MANWNIIRTIDEGGFGKVYEVKSDTGKRGALKEQKNPNSVNLKRFEREINILQTLKHPSIISIYEWNLQGSPANNIGPYYIMEYMEGGSLKEKMAEMFNVKHGLFAQKWALGAVILPVLEAMQLAHSNFTYHRDLKPANLLFTTSQQNVIKVADWGIGKDINRVSIALTVGGIGTPAYCSPEQWFANATVDGRTDIYSLGIMFYEMMTGKIPQVFNPTTGQRFTIPTPSSQNHPSISAALDNAILKMMAYDAINRYQTVSQLKTELNTIYRSM